MTEPIEKELSEYEKRKLHIGQTYYIQTKEGFLTRFKIVDVRFHYGNWRYEGIAHGINGPVIDLSVDEKGNEYAFGIRKDERKILFDLDVEEVEENLDDAYVIVQHTRTKAE